MYGSKLGGGGGGGGQEPNYSYKLQNVEKRRTLFTSTSFSKIA